LNDGKKAGKDSQARIGRQIVLPFSKSFEIALKGIQVRLGRSIVTMGGIVLAIAFLMSIWTSNAFSNALRNVDEQAPDYKYVQQALQEHALATEGVSVRVAVLDDLPAAGEVPVGTAVLNVLQSAEQLNSSKLPNRMSRFKESFREEYLGRPDAVVVVGIPSELATVSALSILRRFVEGGGVLMLLGGEQLLPADAEEGAAEFLRQMLPATITGETVTVDGSALQIAADWATGTIKWKEHPATTFAVTEARPDSRAIVTAQGKALVHEWKIRDGIVLQYPLAADTPSLSATAQWLVSEGFLTESIQWHCREKLAGLTTSNKDIWLVSLSLLVCVVGISSAMLMSVTERFREIGTMKCLGALDRFIVRLFLIESSFQGLAGSATGLVLGLLLAVARSVFAFKTSDPVTGEQQWLALRHFPFAQLLSSAALALAIGVILSVVAAIYPAYRAAKMQPVEAMRASQ